MIGKMAMVRDPSIVGQYSFMRSQREMRQNYSLAVYLQFHYKNNSFPLPDTPSEIIHGGGGETIFSYSENG